MLYGAEYVILCERGIRTFDDETRFTLDLGMVSYLKTVTYLPIIVDPSHASGRRDLVESMTMAAMAGGAHGAIIEVHPDPDKALSDGKQSLTLEGFEILKKKLDKLGKAIDDGKNVL